MGDTIKGKGSHGVQDFLKCQYELGLDWLKFDKI